MVRRSASDAQHTKQRILDEGVARASVDGLEGLTIGTTAEALGMSKAGVIGPFGSKLELQLAVLHEAVERFVKAVVRPAVNAEPGVPRLVEAIDRWVVYLVDSPFPNGCFITAASCELDGRPGPLHDQLQDVVVRWRAFLHDQITIAQTAGDIAPDRDPTDLVQTLSGLAMAANQAVQLLAEPDAAARTRRLMLAALTDPS